MRKRLKNGIGFNRERGDTIVEVLIAIAVVSLVLGGAYIATNRSLQATRAAQERAVALKLAESQIERIKGLASSATGNAALFVTSAPFCVAYSIGLPVDDTHEECTLNITGAKVASGQQPAFHISITRSNNNDFVLTETWHNVNGKVTDSLQLRYRVYE